MNGGLRGRHKLTKLSLYVNRTILFQGSQHQEQIQPQYEVGVEANAFGKCNNLVFVRYEIIKYENPVNHIYWILICCRLSILWISFVLFMKTILYLT